MSKSEILLHLFYLLQSGKVIHRHTFCCEMKISERSFYRYTGDIKNFLIEFGLRKELREDSGNYYFIDC